MGVLLMVLFIILGALAAKDFVIRKAPILKDILETLYTYAEYIGLAGLLCGFITLLEGLSALRWFEHHPLTVLLSIASGIISMLLGLMLSLPLLHKFMNEPTPPFLLQCDTLCIRLAPYRRPMGIALIVIGIIFIVLPIVLRLF